MADPSKQQLGVGGGNLMSDLKSMFSVLRTRRTMWYAYGFMFTFIALTAFLAFGPSNNSSSPWFNNIFSSSDPSQKPQFSFLFYFLPNSSQTPPNITNSSPLPIPQISPNITNSSPPPISQVSANITDSSPPISQTSPNITRSPSNTTSITPPLQASISNQNQTVPKQPHLNQTVVKQPQLNQTLVKPPPTPKNETVKGVTEQNRASNFTASLLKGKNNSTNGNTNTTATKTKEEKGQISTTKDKGRSNSMMQCDIFDGNWVKDDSYPLYKPGSCALIDEQFNCYNNGRPDKDFLKYRWQPKHCNIPRLNGRDMLELLRGKRLVFVGDSLNRNMWESLVCILRNSVRDKSKVYEASGRREFRTDNSYLFIFKDYNCTVEFFRSPFLVQEWEMPEGNGSTKETLRLDLVEKSSSKYKTADVIVFNTGHWWTHEKTSKGKDYYQEGKHVYGELNVVEAFRKALTTWAKWVDVNINPKKTLVMFRGYSASHFSGGQWNSGGQCDDETEPIKNDTYLTNYPPKMRVLESVLNGMKMPVTYLNITRMTDYRKDGHPSIYRKQHLSEEERKSPLRFQDCSHWCLPGVPDSWNELLYAQLLIKKQQQQQQQQQKEQQIQKQQKKQV